MKKSFNRILSLVLVLMMVLSLAPVSAFAEAAVEEPVTEAAPVEEVAAAEETTPVEETPAAPVEETPAAPVEEAPAAPVEEAPAAPAEETPAAPAEETPAAPVEEEEVAEAVPAEGVADEAAEALAEEEYPMQSFNYRADVGTEITVDAPEGAFPEGTKMVVTEKNLDEVQKLVDAAEDVDGNVVAAVDISFYDVAGAKIQPKVPVYVSYASAAAAQAVDPQIVHISDAAAVDVVTDVTTEVAAAAPMQMMAMSGFGAPAAAPAASSEMVKLSFAANSFSIYAIIEVPVAPEAGEYSKEESGIAVSVVTEDGTFDEPVVLSVAAIDAASDAYATAEEELAKIGVGYDGMVAFDIHFTSQATGAEVEPNKPVDVKIEITDALAAGVPEEALGALTITHIFDNGGAEVVSAPAETVEEEIALPEVAEFETSVFSTYTVTWTYGYKRNVTVHYGYMDGTAFREFPNGTPKQTPSFTYGSYAYLIYDVDGYEYNATYYRTSASNTPASGGTSIYPLLDYDRDGDWYYYNQNNQNGYLANNSHIYVTYKAKTEPTTGGTPVIDDDEVWPEDERAPQFSKDSVNNGNGTNTIALEIVAAEKPVQKSSPADVIVVFDVSGSMGDNMNGRTRLYRAQQAVNKMANTLMGEGSDVQMALISFSNEAKLVQGFTNNAGSFTNAVDRLSADGGTNWEDGLELANTLTVRPEAGTFVVFVTDGDPTFRVSRGNVSDGDLDVDTSYYLYYNVFGTGSDDDDGRNFSFAVDQVKAIVAAKKEFYSIGISNDVTKVQTLTTQGGVDADHAFIASDNDAMEKAFDAITNSIKAVLGFGDVEITDGITELTNAEMKVMQSVDPNSFKYYRYGGENNKYGADKAHMTEWTTREADGCAAASYNESDGAVHWDMGETFQLENGVHYVVTFNVWASQDAYDLIAELNNGSKTYASLTEAEKAQIVENKAPTATEPGSYALKTNTDKVNATYSQTTKNGDKVTVNGEEDVDATYHAGTIQDMKLESMKLTVKKVFEDDLTAGEDRDTDVTLVLKRRAAHQNPEADFAPFEVMVNGKMTSEITLSDANEWTATFYVAPGVEVDGKVLEHGYDFTIAEPGIDYHYGLIEEIINPMVVDGEDKYYGDGELIESKETVQEYVDRSLTAVNRVKSGIDIRKILVDTTGNVINSDEEFTFTGKLLDADGNPYIWSQGDNVNNSGAYHKFSPDAEGTYTFDDFGYGKKYKQTVYKGHFASTDSIEFTLKPGEFVRFINVPDGCTFEFSESATPSTDYTFKSVSAVTQHRVSKEGDWSSEGDVAPVPTSNGAKLAAPGVVGNKQYVVAVTNESVHGEYFYVYHSSDNTIEKIYADDVARVTKGAYDASKQTYDYTFNIYNETKAGYMYGGYYQAYGGQVLTDDGIRKLTFDQKGSSGGVYISVTEKETNWTKDDSGCVPYTGSVASAWKADKAYTENPGTAMKPVANGVYYLKEVPNGYLRPYIQIVYDTYHRDADGKQDNPLVGLHLVTAVDDANYQKVGNIVNGEPFGPAKLSALATIKDAQGKVAARLTAKGVYDGKQYGDTTIAVPRGFLSVLEKNDLLVANTDFEMKPYFITLDGVEVYGYTTRVVKPGNLTYVPTDGDHGVGILPGITVEDKKTVFERG